MASSTRLLSSYRRKQILELLRGSHMLRAVDLAQRFGVTEVTIRRDLELLAAEGLVERVHGGVLLAGAGVGPDYHAREDLNRAAKQRIARATVDLIQEGEAVILDVGTTTAEVAKARLARENITVITSSPPCRSWGSPPGSPW